MLDRRITLEPGESYVVASVEFWEGMVRVCRDLAEQYDKSSSNRIEWLSIANDIETQVAQNRIADWSEWEDDEDD